MVGDICIVSVTRRDSAFAVSITLTYVSYAAGNAVSWKNVFSPVYAAEHGQYFHLQADCSGLENAKEMTAAAAVEAGKWPCEICAGASPWEKEDLTVYMTKFGVFFHGKPDCSGMSRAESVSLKRAVEAGKQPCPLCIDLNEESGEHGWRLEGENFALSFTTLNRAGAWYVAKTEEGKRYSVTGGETFLADGSRAPFFAITAQVGLIPEGTLTLTRVDENGRALGSVTLTPTK